MALQRHEDMEQHMGPCTCVDPMHLHGPYVLACLRSIFLGVLPHTCVGGECDP